MSLLNMYEQQHKIEEIGIISNFIQHVQHNKDLQLLKLMKQVLNSNMLDSPPISNVEPVVDDQMSPLADIFNLPLAFSEASKPTVLTIERLLKCHTSCGMKLSQKVKDRYTNVRGKNINNVVNKSKNKFILINNDKIKQLLKNIEKIKDPTKSCTFNFFQLALLAEYSNNEQFFQIFETNQTIKKNKGTKQLSKEELEQVLIEMRFFKQVAKKFYDDPLEAILMAYLRNHNVNKIKEGKLDAMTIEGIKKTVKVLNMAPSNYNINIEFSNEFVNEKKKK